MAIATILIKTAILVIESIDHFKGDLDG